jgi:predicted dithiol-disulfide oxidoreductase (DUF899 family)
MPVTFPNESAGYRAARDELLNAEIALRRQMEAVAAMRRKLPPGGLLPKDYVFDGLGADGKPAQIRFSELFSPGRDTLLMYNMMFPRYPTDTREKPCHGELAGLEIKDTPCPSCTALLDQLEGAAAHVEAAGFNFVVVGKTALDNMLALARDRGWKNMRMLSAANNSFKRDYHCEDENGNQLPLISVFTKASDGIRHFWSSELNFAPADPGQDPRAAGTIEPLWNLMDFTPAGRPNWDEGFNDAGPEDAKPALAAA